MTALASVDPTSIGRPSTTPSPPPRPSSPQIIEIVVVLPAPLGPSRPYVSPAATEKLTPSTAVREPKRLRRSRQSSTGVGMAIHRVSRSGRAAARAVLHKVAARQ